MKKFISLLLSALLSLVNVFYKAVAFVVDHYIPKRDFRLNGLKQKATATVNQFVHSFNEWRYEMFARWHVDSYTMA